LAASPEIDRDIPVPRSSTGALFRERELQPAASKSAAARAHGNASLKAQWARLLDPETGSDSILCDHVLLLIDSFIFDRCLIPG
jgi:hypothetical protein